MPPREPSLTISLGHDGTTVRLRAGTDFADALHRLSSAFRSAQLRSFGSIDIAIEDLLSNLAVLARWPDPDNVAWDPAAAALARDSYLDAQTVANRLEPADTATDEIAPQDVLALLDPGWCGDLTDFQRRDAAKLLSLRHGANFSVPGAGKTRVSLAVFHALRNNGSVNRMLVIGPKSSFESWVSEIEECFTTPLSVHICDDGETNPIADVLIINYERLPGSLGQLARWLSAQPCLLILDEAHRMKLGAAGAYGTACLALGPRATRRLILTGTPAPNGVRDLANLFSFVWPGQGSRTVNRAVANGDLAHASRVLRPLFARTTKAELRLPPLVPKRRDVDLPPLHREIYDALLGHYSRRAAESAENFQALGKIVVYLLMAAINPALLTVGTTRYEPLTYRVPPLAIPEDSALSALMRDLPSYELSPKYRETLAIVARNAKEGRRTIVWSTFVRSLTTLEQILEGYSPAVVHGGTEDREEQLRKFRDDADCMVLLSNPATLGEGISLHNVCHDAVYVDRDFAAGRFMQSLDRIHRLGLHPDTELRVTVLTSKNTIDEVVADRLAAKLRFMGRILDDPTVQELGDLADEPEVGGGLGPDDLQALMGHLHAHST